jgi:hypothetical protein
MIAIGRPSFLRVLPAPRVPHDLDRRIDGGFASMSGHGPALICIWPAGSPDETL